MEVTKVQVGPMTESGIAKTVIVNRSRWTFALLCLLFVLGVVIVVAAAHGAAGFPYRISAAVLLDRIGIDIGVSFTVTQQRIVEQIRLPRIFLAAMVGAALSMSGVAMQGLFRNPMASPGIIGVSNGGALGAVITMVTGLYWVNHLLLPLFAFIGAGLATGLVYGIAMRVGRGSLAGLILSGVAVSTFLSAVMSLVITLTVYNLDVLREIVFWLMGGLDARSWLHVRLAALPIGLGAAILTGLSKDLNVLLLGEAEAESLGVRMRWTRRMAVLGVAMLTGAAVSVSGVIGFVGLVVPHMVRLVLGPDHRILLPASALTGAIFLIAADTVARTVVNPGELRVGLVTALVGAPFFVFLLYRHRRGLAHY